MPTFNFPVGASASRGDSSLWDLDFTVTDEEAERLKKHAEEDTCLSRIKETSDIYDRLLPELLAQQAEVYEEEEELIQEVADHLNKPAEDVNRKDVLEYLTRTFRFSIYFPEAFIREATDPHTPDDEEIEKLNEQMMYYELNRMASSVVAND